MDVSNAALTLFVTTEVVNVAALLVDYVLIKAGLDSITTVSTTYPIVGITIIAFETISPIALGIHFLYYRSENTVTEGHV